MCQEQNFQYRLENFLFVLMLIKFFVLMLIKTEIILFKTSKKNYDAELKIKFCRKKESWIPVR